MPTTTTQLTLALCGLAAVQASSVYLPNKLPAYGKPLPKDLIGLSIEMDRWPSWAGPAVGQPNKFFNQALENLASLTGHAVPIRVGANSEDRGYIQPGVQVANSSFPEPTNATPYPEASIIGIGKDFYAISTNLPDGTPFTWGINLKGFNTTETVAQAELLYDTFYGSRKDLASKIRLEVIEIGNEPDFYNEPRMKHSLPGWDINKYVSTWTDVATKVEQAIDIKGKDKPKFQIGAYAGFVPNFIFDVVGTLGSGVLDSSVGKYLSTFSYHHYNGAHSGDPSRDVKPGGLMARGYTRANLTATGVYVSQANAAGIEFTLGETNSFANHGTPGVSDSAEGAMWLLDYSLQAASLGVRRLFFHEGIGYAYNLIQPVAVSGNGPNSSPKPRVQSTYYGAVIANEAIGTGKDTSIAELVVNAPNTIAYGIWEGKKLARAVIINTDVYLPSVNSTRSEETVSLLNFPSAAKVSVKRLSAPATNATHGLTWGGQSYETDDAKPTGKVVEEWLSGPSVQIKASEAVLLCFK